MTKQSIDYNNKIKQLASLFFMFNPYYYYNEENIFYFSERGVGIGISIVKPFKAFYNYEEGFYINLFYTIFI